MSKGLGMVPYAQDHDDYDSNEQQDSCLEWVRAKRARVWEWFLNWAGLQWTAEFLFRRRVSGSRSSKGLGMVAALTTDGSKIPRLGESGSRERKVPAIIFYSSVSIASSFQTTWSSGLKKHWALCASCFSSFCCIVDFTRTASGQLELEKRTGYKL